jgi:hypothetical protein
MQYKWQIEFKFHILIMRESWAAHDRELGYYTSFRLCRGCTLYPQVMLPICQGIPTPMYLYQGSEAGQHYEAFTKFH